MVLALAVLVGLIASTIRHRGRTWAELSALPLRSVWLAPLALALQLPLLRAPAGPTHHFAIQQALFLASHLLLLILVWQNRWLAGMLIVGHGVLCNLVVIAANGGFMPITPETLLLINPGTTMDQWPIGMHYGYSKDVILPWETTRLWALSDVFVVPPPFPWPTAFSPGDIFIAIGMIVLLQGPDL
jgi:hypothetical protein